MITKTRIIFLLLLITLSCSKQNEKISAKSNSTISIADKPRHIIVVLMENHGFDEIIGNPDAPYINSLADSGTVFTNFHGITHPSQPNYIGFFSGSTQGVTNDSCLEVKWAVPNLYSKLTAVRKTCAWYSENLPTDSCTICKAEPYVQRHNPTTHFKNVPGSANKMFSELPADYDSLPNLVLITPNVNHDMHNGSIKQGDDWIKSNLKGLADWCKISNSIFIITFDEDDHTRKNQIPVIAFGKHVISHNTVSDSLDHYNMTKTICSLLRASTTWTDNLNNRQVITGWLY